MTYQQIQDAIIIKKRETELGTQVTASFQLRVTQLVSPDMFDWIHHVEIELRDRLLRELMQPETRTFAFGQSGSVNPSGLAANKPE